jgi:hypothetical protein
MVEKVTSVTRYPYLKKSFVGEEGSRRSICDKRKIILGTTNAVLKTERGDIKACCNSISTL